MEGAGLNVLVFLGCTQPQQLQEGFAHPLVIAARHLHRVFEENMIACATRTRNQLL